MNFPLINNHQVAWSALLLACIASSGIDTRIGIAAEDSIVPIRELLAKRCLRCHNPSEKKGGLDLSARETALTGGDSGPALERTMPESSLLWKRVSALEMPPKSGLSEEERNRLWQWLQNGSPWPGGKLDAFEFTSEDRAGYDWWSLQPLRRVQPPASAREPHPIDAFVVTGLVERGMQMSAIADERILKRRIAYHLTGLPPSLFCDEHPGSNLNKSLGDPDLSIEAWIDALLDRPEYGQRWARHWLDAVRFGESHGFERDQLRTNSWRYRDWVVRALNRDMPYQQFAQYQIAGDAIKPGDAEGIIATGMLVAGPYDQVGQTQQSNAMRAVVRQDELEDLVSVISQTFLGLTANCSRCHDHKFDPIPQQDYYRLCASLAGTHHGDVKLSEEYVAAETEAVVARIETQKKAIRAEIDQIEGGVREQILAERRKSSIELIPPMPMARWEFDDLRDTIGGLDLELKSTAALRDGKLSVGGTGYAVSKPLTQDIREKTLEAWVLLHQLNQGGGAAISVETADGAQFDGIVYGEREAKRWVVGSNHFARSDSFRAGEAESALKELIHIAMVFSADGTIRAYRNGKPYGKAIRKSDAIAFPASQSHVLFGLRHTPFTEAKVLQASIDRAQLYDRALSDDEVFASSQSYMQTVTIDEILAKLDEHSRERLTQLRFEHSQLQEQWNRARDVRVYAAASKPPETTYLLARGNTTSPMYEVLPGGISAVRGLPAEFGIDAKATNSERRLALAKWVTDERNPLFARVIANRVWKQHFGTGLVATPNDFGFNGARPTHPELLDWLAMDLIEHGWSLKHLHRRILTSKTYQQSSRPVAEYLNTDSESRYYWRHSPTRLDAEALRDTLLWLARKLDCRLDGPGYYDFEMTIQNSHFYFMRDPLGESFQRRTLYRTLVRSARSNLLDVFDCPDPSTKAPQRTETTTPLQSLSLMNNGFVIRMADAWAQRLIQEGVTQGDDQINRIFLDAYGRTPTPDELADCRTVLNRHGLETVCRVLLNSNELLYVD